MKQAQVQQQIQQQNQSPPPSWGEIGGRQYRISGDVAQCTLRPGEQPGNDVHATMPHHDPFLRAMGYKVAVIFLSTIAFVCIVAMMLRVV